ncbi:hypothetical protein BJ322DRAFT_1104400 [Thelephora terrestris]|uniref:Uncharacterized protein n=1 Tax=Thelephora terrestris TaxID=56493 RepID=A0A9P6HP53_9AGAM|nr:hypothetical protein BJ322DRAFT_1104400 [Thelephora terrestris]
MVMVIALLNDGTGMTLSDKFGVHLENAPGVPAANDRMLHMIIYLQVAIISQALIFVTRSHGFFFMERPSAALFFAFCVAQLVSSIIAAYGDWGFTKIRAISGGWIGIVWVLNIIWFIPLDLVKFAMKATVIKYPRQRRERRTAGEASLEATGISSRGPPARSLSSLRNCSDSAAS